MDMDLNIDNYTMPELFIILNLSDEPTHPEVRRKSNEVIERMKSENKHIFADFFVKARDRILEYLDSIDAWEKEYSVILEDMITDKEAPSITEHVSRIDDTLIKRNSTALEVNPQYQNTNTRMIVVNSAFVSTQDTCDFTVDLSEPINDVLSISLYSFHIPYTWYSINSSKKNNSLALVSSFESVSIEIDYGNYSNESLVSTVNEQLQSVDLLSGCVYNSINGKTIVTLSNEIEEITFYDEDSDGKEKDTLGYMLGFRKSKYLKPVDTEMTWSVTSESLCTTYGTKYLQLCVDDFNRNRLNSNIANAFDDVNNSDLKTSTNFNFSIERNENDEVVETNPRTLTQNQIYAINQIQSNRLNNRFLKPKTNNASDLLAMIPTKHHQMNLGDMCVEFGGSMQNNRRQYFGPVTLSRLHVKLVDEEGRVLDLNKNDWSFTILCETLYQGTQKK